MTNYRLINLCANNDRQIIPERTKRIGVDTEFMRERTYYAKLCLLQVSTNSEIICIDPLGSSQTDVLLPNQFWQEITQFEWVLHAARQDLEIVYETSNLLPHDVFDTQIAAALLGFPAQVGYAKLVSDLFNVELDKAYTRADWSKRPLSKPLLKYAAEDVHYLLPAYEQLVARLKSAGRLDWAIEDSRNLLDVSLYKSDPSTAIERLKGARTMQGKSWAAAARLASWREREAIRTNRPRQWVLSDRLLLKMAALLPNSMKTLASVDGLPEKTVQWAGKDLLQIIEHAETDQLRYEGPRRPDEKGKAILKEMQQKVKVTAQNLKLAPELIAPKKELSAAVIGNRKSRVFCGWRQEIIGNQLLELLEGS